MVFWWLQPMLQEVEFSQAESFYIWCFKSPPHIKIWKYNGNVNHVSYKPEERSKLTDKFLGREFSVGTAIWCMKT